MSSRQLTDWVTATDCKAAIRCTVKMEGRMNEIQGEDMKNEGSSQQVIKSIMQSEIIKINVMLRYGLVWFGMLGYVMLAITVCMVTTMSLTLPHIKLTDCIIYRFLSIYL